MDLNKIELLAPAGKWDVLEKVIDSGADAVYLGGKGFNMRMLRPEFNFSDQEINAAALLLHEKSKKLYITVNNLYSDTEISNIKDYLLYLEQIGVDGLIVQDMGIVKIHQELGLKTPLHASVQMGIANLPAVKYLENLGFCRAILSKNLTIEEINSIYQQAKLEIEFFVHGDLCISHTGQCLLSSFIAGESANRGRCLKPCRWQYSLSHIGAADNFQHLLASNDLCLYPYLIDLINAGVVSFKIEGRMRDKEYLGGLIKIYRQALDRIIKSPEDYIVDIDEVDRLAKGRIRDFTVGNLFGKPRKDSVDPTGAREPLVFSQPVVLKPLIFNNKPIHFDKNQVHNGNIKELTVKVSGLDSAVKAIASGADNLIIGLEQIRQAQEKWNHESICRALALGKEAAVQVWLETPRIVTQKDIDHISEVAALFDPNNIDGVVVNDYGTLKLFKDQGYRILGGPGLNITNQAAALLGGQGLERITASAELDYRSLEAILKSDMKIELIVHGPLCGLITDYCLAKPDTSCDNCTADCLKSPYGLKDNLSQSYQIRTDNNCRNYLFHPYDLCLFYYMESLSKSGLQYVRIDGQFYDSNLIAQITAIYRRAIDRINQAEPWSAEDYQELIDLFPRGLSSLPLK